MQALFIGNGVPRQRGVLRRRPLHRQAGFMRRGSHDCFGQRRRFRLLTVSLRRGAVQDAMHEHHRLREEQRLHQRRQVRAVRARAHRERRLRMRVSARARIAAGSRLAAASWSLAVRAHERYAVARATRQDVGASADCTRNFHPINRPRRIRKQTEARVHERNGVALSHLRRRETLATCEIARGCINASTTCAPCA